MTDLLYTCAGCGRVVDVRERACSHCGSEDKRRGDWLTTSTGKPFWVLDPRPEDVDIEDIGHHLGMVARFGGACKFHYTVAQHSIHVAAKVQPFLEGTMAFEGKAYLCALLHDAHEAYTGDNIRPMKMNIPDIKAMEDHVQAVIWEHFGLTEIWPQVKDAVKRADNVLLATEYRDVMPESRFPWNHMHEEPDPELVIRWNSNPKGLFLQLFDRLA